MCFQFSIIIDKKVSETTLTWLPMISQRDHGYYWFLGWPRDRVYILQKNQQKRECIYQIPELLWLSILIRLRFHLCSSASPRLKRQVAPAFLYQGLLTTARLLEHSPSLCLAIFCLFRSFTREKFKEVSPNLSFPVNYMSLKPQIIRLVKKIFYSLHKWEAKRIERSGDTVVVG